MVNQGAPAYFFVKTKCAKDTKEENRNDLRRGTLAQKRKEVRKVMSMSKERGQAAIEENARDL